MIEKKKTTMKTLTTLTLLIILSTLTHHATAQAQNYNNDIWAMSGQKFYTTTPTPGYIQYCSVGYPVTDNNGNHYIITAGHCFRSHTKITTHYMYNIKKHQGAKIYDPNTNQAVGEELIYFYIENHTFLDVSLVEIYPGNKLTGQGYVNLPTNPINTTTIGDTACMVGFKENNPQCGYITNLESREKIKSPTTPPLQWDNAIVANYCSHSGDSGGAIYNHQGALGIHVGARNNSYPCISVYEPITYILDEFQQSGYTLYLI